MLTMLKMQHLRNFGRFYNTRKVVFKKSTFPGFKNKHEVDNNKWFHRIAKYGSAAVRYVPLIITHGPKTILAVVMFAGLGYLVLALRKLDGALGGIKQSVADKYDGITQNCADCLKATKERINSLTDSAGSAVNDSMAAAKDAKDAAVSKCQNTIITAGEKCETVKDHMGTVLENASQTAAGAKDSILQRSSNVKESIMEMLKSSKSTPCEKSPATKSKIDNVMNKIKNSVSFGKSPGSDSDQPGK